MAWLRDWLESVPGSELFVCDPYLGPSDAAEILRMVLTVNRTLDITLMTSVKHMRQVGHEFPFREAFASAWRELMPGQQPPTTEIVILGYKAGGDPPVHDRWWLSSHSGIRLGTSFGSLGGDKITELTTMSAEDAAHRLEETEALARGMVRKHAGKELDRTIFSLGS
jgi:hypothetical protein